MKRLQLNPADLKANLKRPSSPATSSSTPVAEATGKTVTSSPLRTPNFPQIEGPSGNDPARINEFCVVVRRPQPFEPETDVLRQCRNNFRRCVELLYEGYLIQRELQAKEKLFSELQREISELRRGVGVNWEEATESADFALVRNAIFARAVKLAKDAVAEKYPELSFDFLEVEDGKVEEEIHSQGAALGREGLHAEKGNVQTGEGEDGAAETLEADKVAHKESVAGTGEVQTGEGEDGAAETLEADKVAHKESGAGTGEDGTGGTSKDILQAEQA